VIPILIIAAIAVLVLLLDDTDDDYLVANPWANDPKEYL
jgi:hypothetical protein